jgi:hypothetical protein
MRAVVNVRCSPGRDGWRAPRRAIPTVRDRAALIVSALPWRAVLPERLGLGAWLLVFCGLVLDAGIIVDDGASAREIRRWASSHLVDCARGRVPWRVLSRTVFNRSVLYRDGYTGRCPIVSADLLRTLGLVAEHWWAPTRADFVDGFAFGLAGWGRMLTRERGSVWWSQDYGKPVVYARAKAARSLRVAFGPPRGYRTPDGTIERRGQWERNGSAYKGRFVELLGAAHTFDGIDTGELDEHLGAFALEPVQPCAVKPDAKGAAHVTDIVRAQHVLFVALNREVRAW